MRRSSITVHLTFAERAYALARYYRALGSKVVMGGLHVLSRPEEVRAHADAIAIAIAIGVRLWPKILADVAAGQLEPAYRADFRNAQEDDPSPDRRLLPRASFLTTTSLNATRGCHNRCGFCYLATDGLKMPYRMRRVKQVLDEIRRDGQPYVVFTDNDLGSNREYLFIGFESLIDQNLDDARKKTPPRHPAERQLRARFRPRPPRRVRADGRVG